MLAAAAPGVEPVGAVELVLVEQVGQPLGELQAAAEVVRAIGCGRGGQELRQRLEARFADPLRQRLHQPPGQRRLVERRAGRRPFAAEHRAVQAPEKTRRQLDPGRRADAAAPGQRHLHPLGDAVALHQQHVLLQRVERVALQPGEDGLLQQLQPVAVQHQQAGRDRGTGRGKASFSLGHGRQYRPRLAATKGSGTVQRAVEFCLDGTHRNLLGPQVQPLHAAHTGQRDAAQHLLVVVPAVEEPDPVLVHQPHR